ncbi:hypothetical protein D3C72_2233340 [compost metagenome]
MFAQHDIKRLFQIAVGVKNNIHLLQRGGLHGNRLAEMPCQQRLGKSRTALRTVYQRHCAIAALQGKHGPQRLADLDRID